ncbi:CorA family divalent cation transporter [Magnetospirillum sp. SS-4]|uniref:CorA family divalent cation transporter n=1 Tax=Magnetospirillum sp. SS-4 TaxID=2681465 RepID=UPI00137C631F|nr:CorA family divalent cation transporter [Magnetospirillum sp. SS-4]CAA7624144.1 Mg2+ and Co2+ transporter [Magnetospirillum sp. SS-4]
MAIDRELRAGLEQGLRFAMLVTPSGRYLDLTWTEVEAWKPEDGFLWVHLERDDPHAQAWVRGQSGIDPLVALALLAEESRPRVQDVGDSLLVVLRGVNKHNPHEDSSIDTELVPIHIWMEASRCISLRDKDHSLNALRDLRLSMMNGKGPRDAGTLMARIAEKVTDHLGDLVEDLEDEISGLEDRIAANEGGSSMRAHIAETRRRVVQFRRYLAPQRDALFRLRHDDAAWLSAESKTYLGEVNDRLVRHLEDLDEIRQRSSILQEEQAAMVAEQGNRNTFVLSIVTVLMLPMTFITGFFGMNTGALPLGADHSHGTWIATAIISAVGAATAVLLRYGLRRRH